MKTKTSNEFVPPALRQVWDWKDAVYQETRQLSTHDALDYILKQGGAIARQLNLPVASYPVIGAPTTVAETPAKYAVKRQDSVPRRRVSPKSDAGGSPAKAGKQSRVKRDAAPGNTGIRSQKA